MTFLHTGTLARFAWLVCLSTSVLFSSAALSADSAEAAWKELAIEPPTAFSHDRLVRLDVSANSALIYGIDPATVSVGTDGVVRYVLVARSTSGALNVLFEGIRCETAEMKTYARWNNAGTWNTSPASPWRPLQFSGPTRHGMVMAKEGVCDGKTPNRDAANILKSLRSGKPSGP